MVHRHQRNPFIRESFLQAFAWNILTILLFFLNYNKNHRQFVIIVENTPVAVPIAAWRSAHISTSRLRCQSFTERICKTFIVFRAEEVLSGVPFSLFSAVYAKNSALHNLFHDSEKYSNLELNARKYMYGFYLL